MSDARPHVCAALRLHVRCPAQQNSQLSNVEISQYLIPSTPHCTPAQQCQLLVNRVYAAVTSKPHSVHVASRRAASEDTRSMHGHSNVAPSSKRSRRQEASNRQAGRDGFLQAMLCMLKCSLTARHSGLPGARASHQYWHRICPSTKLTGVNPCSYAHQQDLESRAQTQAAADSMPGTAAEVCSAADVDCSLFNADLRLNPWFGTHNHHPFHFSRRLRHVQGFKAGGEGWFREVCEMWPGQGLSLKVKEVLLQERSKFQARALLLSCVRTWAARSGSINLPLLAPEQTAALQGYSTASGLPRGASLPRSRCDHAPAPDGNMSAGRVRL